ncbi:MAG TPA: CBS domain-containing protein, partial [Phototrophicaceae bacterium]|nr:CBS domain-containing protein [Phototrophicaceae bacterium]
ADRAMEHGMKNTPVREIMKAGEVVITPTDSIFALEQVIVDSGWGQIPVIQDNSLIGIVTRTDLIKHWARTHPSPAALPATTMITPDQVREILGKPTAALIDAIADHGQGARINLYMVGGVVRDLLLHRPNFDLDFVVETDAIEFARSIQQVYGGEISTHPAFRTAKWRLNEQCAAKLGVDLTALPLYIDFATARNEFYEHPTALPTVYAGSIKLDLQRRDFTINTLAVQLSPASSVGRVLDFYNGLDDLQQKTIRVIHSLSFVDDPTRILRAVRFAQRLDFTIEPRTADLITTSREMLRRITGERVRNELTLLLNEAEPERGLLELNQRGALAAIHPALRFDVSMAADFVRLRDPALLMQSPLPVSEFDRSDSYWHIWLCQLPPTEVITTGERLLISKFERDSLQAAAKLLENADKLENAPHVTPSLVVTLLEGIPDIALWAVWLVSKNKLMQEYIYRYLTTWQHIRPVTTGHTLKALGLLPGPRYRLILERLRTARLDGEVETDEQETALLQTLIAGDLSR